MECLVINDVINMLFFWSFNKVLFIKIYIKYTAYKTSKKKHVCYIYISNLTIQEKTSYDIMTKD